MVGTVPRTPDRRHWDCLAQMLMSPEEFRQYWSVTYQEMALICRCSLNPVNRWFSKGKDHREPEPHHLALLALTHGHWLSWSHEPGSARPLRAGSASIQA